MLSLLPPIILLVAALAWAGLTFKSRTDSQAEATRLQTTAAGLPALRAHNADLREKQTLPQEIERLRRENAQLPEAQAELEALTRRKAALEKQLAEKKDALEREHISRLLEVNRAYSEGLPEASGAPAPAPPAPGQSSPTGL